MTVYHTRGVNHQILTRNYHKMIVTMIPLEKEDGLKMHKDKTIKELEKSEIGGPKIKNGDRVLVQDYIKGETVFWLFGYKKVA